MDEPGTLADIGRPIVGMNAYLGADAILPALAAGADVIIGGRLADPSMYLAPLIHRFGWGADDLARLGAGTLVGHLMECGMQVTGGYFADPGVKDVPDLAQCGYPIAEVAADGSAVITKLPGTGGCVTRSNGEGAIALRGARSGGLSHARRHRRFQPRRDRRRRARTASASLAPLAARGRPSSKSPSASTPDFSPRPASAMPVRRRRRAAVSLARSSGNGSRAPTALFRIRASI